MWHFVFIEVEDQVRFEKIMPVNERIDGIEKVCVSVRDVQTRVRVFKLVRGWCSLEMVCLEGGSGDLPPSRIFPEGVTPSLLLCWNHCCRVVCGTGLPRSYRMRSRDYTLRNHPFSQQGSGGGRGYLPPSRIFPEGGNPPASWPGKVSTRFSDIHGFAFRISSGCSLPPIDGQFPGPFSWFNSSQGLVNVV